MSTRPTTNDAQANAPQSLAALSASPGPAELPSAFERLRSFIFEVTAGRPTGVGDATALVDAPPQRSAKARPRSHTVTPVHLQLAQPLPCDVDIDGDASSLEPDSSLLASASRCQATALDESQSAAPAADEASAALVAEPLIPTSPLAPHAVPRRRSLPAWFASLSVHLTMLALLATVSLATVKRPPELEMLFTPSPEELDEVAFQETALPELSGDVGAIVADDLPAELIDPGQAAIGGFSAAGNLGTGLDVPGDTLPAGTPGGGGPLGEIGSMLGVEGGTGTGAFGSGLGGAPTAKFFGSEIAGRRIVFVLDNSGSMQGGRLETVIAELLRCLDSLKADQEFYVIFHSDAVYPLLYPNPVERYLRPTKANKKLVADWLGTVELCLGDSVEEAINAAASIEPDTVFLLSDGRIQGENKFRVLMNAESRHFPIHTFAVGMNGSVAGRKNLQMIAEANRGDFTESEIPPEMRDLSRRQPRPYHNEIPGAVWGRNVKPFKFGR